MAIGHTRRASRGGCEDRIVEAIADPASLGYAYGAVTEHLGWRRGDEEGTVMALAALGDPTRFRDLLGRAIPITHTGFALDPALLPLRCSPADTLGSARSSPRSPVHPGERLACSPRSTIRGAIIITALAGTPAAELALPPEIERDVFGQAGALLAAWHSAEPPRDTPDITAWLAARGEQWLHLAEPVLPAEQRADIRAYLRDLTELGPPAHAVSLGLHSTQPPVRPAALPRRHRLRARPLRPRRAGSGPAAAVRATGRTLPVGTPT